MLNIKCESSLTKLPQAFGLYANPAWTPGQASSWQWQSLLVQKCRSADLCGKEILGVWNKDSVVPPACPILTTLQPGLRWAAVVVVGTPSRAPEGHSPALPPLS